MCWEACSHGVDQEAETAGQNLGQRPSSKAHLQGPASTSQVTLPKCSIAFKTILPAKDQTLGVSCQPSFLASPSTSVSLINWSSPSFLFVTIHLSHEHQPHVHYVCDFFSNIFLPLDTKRLVV